MPHFLTWNDSQSTVVFYGAAVKFEFVDMIHKIHKDARFIKHRKSLWNFQEIELEDMSVEYFSEIGIDWSDSNNSFTKKVVIVRNALKKRGFAEIFVKQMESEGCKWEFHISECTDEAIKWLDSV